MKSNVLQLNQGNKMSERAYENDRIIIHGVRDLPNLRNWMKSREVNKISTETMDKFSNRMITLRLVHPDGFTQMQGIIVVLNQNHSDGMKARELSKNLFDACLDVVYDVTTEPEEEAAPPEPPKTVMAEALAPKLDEIKQKRDEAAQRILKCWREAAASIQAVVWALRRVEEPMSVRDINQILNDAGFFLSIDSVLHNAKKQGFVEHTSRSHYKLSSDLREALNNERN